jgi:hypothetical protein
MDFIVLLALAGFALLWLIISYDITCQWKLNLAECIGRLPSDMRLPLDTIKIQYALPVWHTGSHNEECQNDNSLSFKVGVGKTDGEGVERTWSVMNPAAFMTKDAGRGVRADTIEGKIDNHNYLKNVGQGALSHYNSDKYNALRSIFLGDTLQRKLLVAIAERDRQVAVFSEVSRTVEREVKREWRKKINEWLEDPLKPNPYTLSLNCLESVYT